MMADETPPLDDERLAEIRARATASWQMLENSETISVEVALTRDVLTLLAEIDRLRAREAAAMAMERAVADRGVYFTLQNGRRCYFCEAETETYTGEPPHKADCPVTKARALLAEE